MCLSVFRRCTPKVWSWPVRSDRCEDWVTTSLRWSLPCEPSCSGLNEKVQEVHPWLFFFLLHFLIIYQLLIVSRWSVCLWCCDRLIPCLALFFSLVLHLSMSFPLPPSFSVYLCLVSLILTSLPLNVVIFCLTSFTLFVCLFPCAVFSLSFLSGRTLSVWLYFVQYHCPRCPYVKK